MKEFETQICTTIEQSQHLLDLGLKPETADMVYEYEGTYPYDCNLSILEDGDYISSNIITEDIPAWSLHRLIVLLNPQTVEFAMSTVYGAYEDVIYNISISIKNGTFNKEYLKQ